MWYASCITRYVWCWLAVRELERTDLLTTHLTLLGGYEDLQEAGRWLVGQEQGVRLWRSEVCGVRQLEGRRGATLLPPKGQRLLVRLRLAGPPLVLDRCNSVHLTSLPQLHTRHLYLLEVTITSSVGTTIRFSVLERYCYCHVSR